MAKVFIAFSLFTLCVLLELPALLMGVLPASVRFRGLKFLKFRAVACLLRWLRVYLGMRFTYDYGTAVLPPQFLVVSNHQSLLDTPVLIDFMGPDKALRFLTKKELTYAIPFISTVLRLEGHACIKRRGGSSMPALGLFARACVKKGYSPVVFPEGTRSRDGRLLPFHSAACRRILGMANLPIVVVALDGGWRLAALNSIWSARAVAGINIKAKVVAVLPALQAQSESADNGGGETLRQERIHQLSHAWQLIHDTLESWQ